MNELKDIIQTIEQHPSKMHVDNDGFLLVSKTLDLALESQDEKKICECIDVALKIFEYNNKHLPIMPGMFSSKMLQLGMSSYASKKFEIAEKIFSCLSDSGNSTGKNNYAYMIRRKETTENSETMLIKAIQLLKEGIIQKESFSYVNLALLLALRCGKDSDWKFADDLVEKMPDDNVSSVQGWWEDVGNSGDIEGLLVHFFLLRHGKIKKSIFGDMEQLSQKLSSELGNFPDWLIVLPRFSSLDDLFETMLDDDFEENLAQYLEKMPRDRKTAEEILEEMTQWDEWELYRILLQEYMEFLSPEEVAKTVQAYRKKFMIPLSSIIDENDLKIADEASTEG